MAIDPDVQALLDGVYARLANVEAATGGSSALGAVGLAEIDSVVSLSDVLTATVDDEDTRLADRLAAVDIAALPNVPLPGGGSGGAPAVDVGIRHASLAGDNTDGLSWATAFHTVKDASIAAGRDSLVKIGKGRFDEEGLIPWHRGQIIQALAPWATDVRLADNGTAPLFVSDPGLPDTEFLHGAGIRNIKIRGNSAVPGPVVEINCRIGEETVIDNVQIHAEGGDGIHAKRGGQPVYWRGIHIFSNGQYPGYGINLERTGGDIWNSVVLHGISGDNNKDGLIRFASSGSGNREMEQLLIVGLKAESSGQGLFQRDVVVLDGTHLAVSIIGAATQHATVPGNSLVKVIGNPNPQILLQNIATGYDHIIDNQAAGFTIDRASGPGGEAVSFLFANGGGEVMRLGSGS